MKRDNNTLRCNMHMLHAAGKIYNSIVEEPTIVEYLPEMYLAKHNIFKHACLIINIIFVNLCEDEEHSLTVSLSFPELTTYLEHRHVKMKTTPECVSFFSKQAPLLSTDTILILITTQTNNLLWVYTTDRLTSRHWQHGITFHRWFVIFSRDKRFVQYHQ